MTIPRIFDLYNQAMMFAAPEYARNAYANWVPEAERDDRCLECGECEAKCPQGYAIIEWLEKADAHHPIAQIDEPEATRIIRHAIDHGVNYVDSAYPYHGGNSEKFLGRALQDGYRERIKLATKMPAWLVKESADFDRYLDEQLARLQTASIDFYLLHGLRAERWQTVRDLGVREWAERKMAEGRIGRLGFSFHDSFEVFSQILDEYDGWAMCQIQYNYMDEQHQAGVRGLRLAAEKGLAVVVMEPLRGGLLAGPPPESVQALWASAPVQRTPADWALQWLWNH